MRRFILFLCFIIQGFYSVCAQKKDITLPSPFIEHNEYWTYKAPCFIGVAETYKWIYPAFTINVPKGLLSWCAESDFHMFFYKDEQAIFIKAYPIHSISDTLIRETLILDRDTSYVPSISYIEDIIDIEKLIFRYTNDNVEHYLKSIEKIIHKNNKNRINLIVRIEQIEILLFNIKKRNFNEFESLIRNTYLEKL